MSCCCVFSDWSDRFLDVLPRQCRTTRTAPTPNRLGCRRELQGDYDVFSDIEHTFLFFNISSSNINELLTIFEMSHLLLFSIKAIASSTPVLGNVAPRAPLVRPIGSAAGKSSEAIAPCSVAGESTHPALGEQQRFGDNLEWNLCAAKAPHTTTKCSGGATTRYVRLDFPCLAQVYY